MLIHAVEVALSFIGLGTTYWLLRAEDWATARGIAWAEPEPLDFIDVSIDPPGNDYRGLI